MRVFSVFIDDVDYHKNYLTLDESFAYSKLYENCSDVKNIRIVNYKTNEVILNYNTNN